MAFLDGIPKAGHVTIFDRSWYGSVAGKSGGILLGTGLEKGHTEINEMEENFHHFGTAIVKFWIHIDQDEQLYRFRAREENPRKQWKLHEEDWRNREMEAL